MRTTGPQGFQETVDRLDAFLMNAKKLLSGIGDAYKHWSIVHADFLAQAFLIALSAFLRFWHISAPAGPVFDEVYFPVFAQNYLDGTGFFDAHPPLGKYLIAMGIRLFGFNPLGVRAMDALFGIGVVVLIYRLGKLLFNSDRIAFLAGLLASLDGLLLVESRAGLINIFAVFFSLAAYYLFLKSGFPKLDKPRWLYIAGAGVCIGAATAVKWIGAASLAVVLITYFFIKLGNRWDWLHRLLPPNPLMQRIGKCRAAIVLSSCTVIPIVVYSSTFLIHLNQNPEYSFIELHQQMFGYHAHLQEPHQYASSWWSWPLLLRPVNYFWEHDKSTQQVSTIVSMGNPVLWWLTIPSVLFAIWFALFRRDFAMRFLLLALFVHYLPFALISRATFLYHFMGALPFTILLLSFALDKLWAAKGIRRELAALAIFLIVLCAIYFYPVWTGLPLPLGAFYQRMWLISWI